jgi:predicted DCC family thiol-disulfide oxidoreductase YuxK
MAIRSSAEEFSDQKIIFFDGVCNLCQRSVQFILTHDPKAIFSFASLQGEGAKKILSTHQLDTEQINSLVLLENGKIYIRSTAALRIAKQLNGIWPILYVFIIVPPFIRDAVYDWISRNRYRWFGKQENCWLPRPEWKKRFLD